MNRLLASILLVLICSGVASSLARPVETGVIERIYFRYNQWNVQLESGIHCFIDDEVDVDKICLGAEVEYYTLMGRHFVNRIVSKSPPETTSWRDYIPPEPVKREPHSSDPVPEGEVDPLARKAIHYVLDRTVIRIYTSEKEYYDRDIREWPYSTGIAWYPPRYAPWWCASVSCEDGVDFFDGKTDIVYDMFFTMHNVDGESNGWGDVPVVVVDGCFHGAYYKQVVVDGQPVTPKMRSAFWLHYNLDTGEMWLG